MPSDHSRRVRYKEQQTRRPRGGREIYGEREDQNRWAKCGYCGFINDKKKTALSGPTSLPGTFYTQSVIVVREGSTGLGSYIVPEVTVLENWLTMDSSDYCFPVNMEPIPPVRQTIWVPGVSRFCAFCGSPNWYK